MARQEPDLPTVLVAEDEPHIAEMIKYNLEQGGFKPTMAGDGDEALRIIEEQTPDLAILDWMMPHRSGLDVCRQLRADRKTQRLPVIMLTARSEEEDRIYGFKVGADDYMVKPFSPKELIARVNALLRRSYPEREAETLTYADIEMNLGAHKVTRNGRTIRLGPTEFRLLRFFMQRPQRVLSRETLLDMVWGRDIYVEIRTVDVHIRRLRSALIGDGEVDPIRTVRGAGYALDVEGF